MNKWQLSIILTLLVAPLIAQNVISGDSIRLEKMLQQIGRYCNTDPDSALWLADSCLILADHSNQPAAGSKAHYLRGVAYKNKSDFSSAETAYQQAISLAQQIPDSIRIADGMYGLGNLKRHQGDYSSALQYLHQALAILKRNTAPKVVLARTYNSIGNLLYTTGNAREAIQQYLQSLAIHQQEGNDKFAASTQANIGGMYVELKSIDSALIYLHPALDYYKNTNNSMGIGAAANNLAEGYLLNKDLAQAQVYADLAKESFKKAKDPARQGMALNTAASIAKLQGNYTAAIQLAKESLEIAQQVERLDNIRDQYENISELYALDENWQQAFNYFQLYSTLKDSLFNENINKQMDEARQQVETIAKDQEINELKIQQRKEKRNRAWLGGGLLLTLFFATIIYWISRSRQKALTQIQQEQENTQRLLLEKEKLLHDLKDAQLKLIQNEKMVSLGQLTAGIAHEINNPINFVSANLTALKLDFQEMEPLFRLLERCQTQEKVEALLPELIHLSTSTDIAFLRSEIQQLLDSIGNGAERTRKIVHSLGTFSRNTSEQFLPANINEGIKSTLVLLRGNLPPNIKISSSLAELPPVICQISRLNQVFLNLINNATQAIEGDGKVHIETKQVDQRVHISISDTGKGMDEATRQRIFEPFFTTKGVGSGTGLGLSISYGIIKQHQGEIRVESALNKGTRFLLDLPIDPTV